MKNKFQRVTVNSNDYNIRYCPFCGSGEEKVIFSTTVAKYGPAEDDEDVMGYTIQCVECGIDMSDEYANEVVSRWNKRSKGKSVPQNYSDGRPCPTDVILSELIDDYDLDHYDFRDAVRHWLEGGWNETIEYLNEKGKQRVLSWQESAVDND